MAIGRRLGGLTVDGGMIRWWCGAGGSGVGGRWGPCTAKWEVDDVVWVRIGVQIGVGSQRVSSAIAEERPSTRAPYPRLRREIVNACTQWHRDVGIGVGMASVWGWHRGVCVLACTRGGRRDARGERDVCVRGSARAMRVGSMAWWAHFLGDSTCLPRSNMSACRAGGFWGGAYTMFSVACRCGEG